MFGIVSTQVVIAAAVGIVFGNLLPFPKAWWDKATMVVGVALVLSVGWLAFEALNV